MKAHKSALKHGISEDDSIYAAEHPGIGPLHEIGDTAHTVVDEWHLIDDVPPVVELPTRVTQSSNVSPSPRAGARAGTAAVWIPPISAPEMIYQGELLFGPAASCVSWRWTRHAMSRLSRMRLALRKKPLPVTG